MSFCTLYRDGRARTVTERMCAVARYYDISSKSDRRDIFIVHDQKPSYRLVRAVKMAETKLEFFTYDQYSNLKDSKDL